MAIRCVVTDDTWSMTGSRTPELTFTSPQVKHTLVITEDSPEPMIALFVVEGGLIYLDKAADGSFAAYEDGFTLLELTRNHYRNAGVDQTRLDALIR